VLDPRDLPGTEFIDRLSQYDLVEKESASRPVSKNAAFLKVYLTGTWFYFLRPAF
jgi:hypothetical protein